jgi:hypothetical protein
VQAQRFKETSMNSAGTWNFRVMEFRDPDTEEVWQAIHEVHYDGSGKPIGYSTYPTGVVSHDDGGHQKALGWVLDRMREALDRPVLVESDFDSEPSADAAVQEAGEAARQDQPDPRQQEYAPNADARDGR